MHRVDLTEEEEAFIAARVAAFAREAPPELLWQSEFVEQFDALPLFLGWTETFGIRRDGALVRWSTEREYSGLRSIDSQLDVNVALVAGSDRYPKLARLFPRPPPDATICVQCHGVGRLLPADQPLICSCGGTGWRLAAHASAPSQPIRGGRDLSSQERSLIEWMLRAGSNESERLLEHLAAARVVGRCSCGCASIGLAVPGRPIPKGGLRVIADFCYGHGASTCGAFVFEQDGVLAGLEVYGLGDLAPQGLPATSDLRTWEEGLGAASALKPSAG
jgi:hypothetical protein